jgi:hypothetical protein
MVILVPITYLSKPAVGSGVGLSLFQEPYAIVNDSIVPNLKTCWNIFN